MASSLSSTWNTRELLPNYQRSQLWVCQVWKEIGQSGLSENFSGVKQLKEHQKDPLRQPPNIVGREAGFTTLFGTFDHVTCWGEVIDDTDDEEDDFVAEMMMKIL